MHPLSWKVMAWSLGLFAAVSFVLCVLYGLVVPKTLHMVQFLEITLPGFRWLSPGSFVLGLVESFLTVVHGGKTYYFCSAGCKATFEKAPAKYAGK